MRKLRLVVLVLMAIMTVVTAAVSSAEDRSFKAQLSGGEEVPPNDLPATGKVSFKLSKDGTELSFKLSVKNLENPVAAHIHLAPPGVIGGVVVPLFSGTPASGEFSGVLAEGTITAANLTGALAGQPLSALIAQIEAGNAYVNVHTNDGVRPGDQHPRRHPWRRDSRSARLAC